MAELGQFNLQLTLEGLRALGKNIEDQAGTIEHPAFQLAFEVSLLGWRQGMIEQHHVDLPGRDLGRDFLEFDVAGGAVPLGDIVDLALRAFGPPLYVRRCP